MKTLLTLFLSMMKIGFFTFGGGYAMIGLMEGEFVDKRHWLTDEEYLDMVAIAESTPGPIAINCATYIGYKQGKFLGAVLATLGMCLPSFLVIYLISLFFDAFLAVPLVANAFRGIQVCVVYLILTAGVKMLKKQKKSLFHISLFVLTLGAMLTLTILKCHIFSIFYVLAGGTLGVMIYAVGKVREKKK